MPSNQHPGSTMGSGDQLASDPESSESESESANTHISLRDRIIPFTALGVVIVLMGVLAYTLYTPSTSSMGEGGRVNSTGNAVFLGDRAAPEFTLPTFDGDEVSLADFEGQYVVINFWSSWCPPCRDEAPMLNAFHTETQSDGEVVLLGVAIWDSEEDSLDFMRQHDLTFTNLNDQRGSVLIDYGVYGVPETYFIGPDGTLLGKYRGPLESSEHIAELLSDFDQSES